MGGTLLGDKSASAVFDTTKLKRLVPDFRTETLFAEGIRRTVAWFDADPARRAVDAATDARWDRLVAAYERGLAHALTAFATPAADPRPAGPATLRQPTPTGPVPSRAGPAGVPSDRDPVAYHLVPAAAWAGAPSGEPFRPTSLQAEGFVHLTHRMTDLVDVANDLYRHEAGPHVVLTVVLGRLSAPWRYDGDERFPHVYGPLDRAAVTAVRPIERDAAGAFLPVDPS